MGFLFNWFFIEIELHSTRIIAGAVLFVSFGIRELQSGWRNFREQCLQITDQKTKPISQATNGFGVPNFRLGLRSGHKQK